MIEEKTALQIVSNIIDKFYDDTIHPPAKELGYVLGRIIHTLRLIGLIGFVGDGADIIENILKKKMEPFLYTSFSKTPSDKRVLPDPTIICPLLENVVNSFNKEDIVKLYSNLLSAATNKDTIEKVHPAFITIISQMTPLDAKIFSQLNNFFYLIIFKIFDSNENKNKIISQNIYIDDNYTEVDNNISISINNLERLELIQKDYRYSLIFEPDIYEPIVTKFKKTDYYKKYQSLYGEKNLNVFTQKVYISELGIAFKNICFENE